MFYNENFLHEQLTQAHYIPKTVRPWHVQEGDVIILSDHTQHLTRYFPVVVTIPDHYKDFRRSSAYNPNAKISHKTYRFWHKPMFDVDASFLRGWDRTEAYTFDTVEIYRPTIKINNPTDSAPPNTTKSSQILLTNA